MVKETTSNLVSVVMPAYNCDRFIGAAIESVLGQTHTSHEVIVVDDGSTDNTVQIVKGFGDKVKLIEQSHSGLPAVARNRAIAASTGGYIAFLDADDLWEPEKLARQIAIFEQHPDVGLVCGNAYHLRPEISDKKTDLYLKPRQGSSGSVMGDLLRDNFVITSTVMVERELLDQTGFFCEEPWARAIEDYDLWLRAAAMSQLFYLDMPLAVYRDQTDSIRHLNSLSFFWQGQLLILDRLERHLKKLGKWDRANAKLIEREAFDRRRRLEENNVLKLHLGCGQRYLPGYINVDFPQEKHSVQPTSKADLHADIRGLSYAPESVDEIRSHHVFEHFDRVTALALLVRWYTWLKEDGKLVIEVPDFKKCVSSFSLSRRPEKQLALLRHLFGSHEADWALHLDGWYAAKFKLYLGSLGFNNLKFDYTKWRGLHNVKVTAEKHHPFKAPVELREAAEGILRLSLIDRSETEERLLSVWQEELTRQLGGEYENPAHS